MNRTIMLLLSGGFDSVTLLHDLASQDNVFIHSLIFDYGQKNGREIGFARMQCDSLQLPFTVIELHRIKGLFQHSIITDGTGSVIVPNRNAVLLNIAASIAAGAGVESVLIGCNQDDAENFPDCRPAFINAVQHTLQCAGVPVEICAPYLFNTKRQIAALARKLGVDISKTYSCYEGGFEPCGKCLACRKREEALA